MGQNTRFSSACFPTRRAELAYAQNPTDPVLAPEYPAEQIAAGTLAYEPIEGTSDVDLSETAP